MVIAVLILKILLARKEMGFFNNTLNTFYLWFYSVSHMVKDHSDSKRGNLLLPLHGLLFPISCTDRIAHNMAFVTPTVEHWLEWKIAQWVHQEGSTQQPITPWADILPRSYIWLCFDGCPIYKGLYPSTGQSKDLKTHPDWREISISLNILCGWISLHYY